MSQGIYNTRFLEFKKKYQNFTRVQRVSE